MAKLSFVIEERKSKTIATSEIRNISANSLPIETEVFDATVDPDEVERPVILKKALKKRTLDQRLFEGEVSK